jgi:hypothetical protein
MGLMFVFVHLKAPTVAQHEPDCQIVSCERENGIPGKSVTLTFS